MSKRKTISQKIARATVTSLVKESDRGCVTLVSSILEDSLTRIHEVYVTANLAGIDSPNDFIRESLQGLYGPLSNFAGKINIAYAYGLISGEEYKALTIIRKLRNEAAHCNFEFSLADAGVKALIDQLEGYEIIKRQTFYLDGAPVFSGLDNSKRVFVLSCVALRQILDETYVKRVMIGKTL